MWMDALNAGVHIYDANVRLITDITPNMSKIICCDTLVCVYLVFTSNHRKRKCQRAILRPFIQGRFRLLRSKNETPLTIGAGSTDLILPSTRVNGRLLGVKSTVTVKQY